MLCLLACAPLRAEAPQTPDPALLEAQVALANGMQGAALERGVTALKKRPLAAAENLQVSLTMFWLGMFEDAARYMRRALADDAAVLASSKDLRKRVPVVDASARLNELAKLAPEQCELCFLTGALLLLDRDMKRALPFLIRAEELAGTDGQIAQLMGSIDVGRETDRNLLRGVREMKAGAFETAVRSFAFSAMDRPRQGVSYAGMALGLAAEADDKMALRFAAIAEERALHVSLVQWLSDAAPASAPLAAAGIRFSPPEGTQEAAPNRTRFAAWLFFAAGYYASANRAAVALLVENRQDELARALLDYMKSRGLADDPVSSKPPEKKPDDPPHKDPPVEPQPEAKPPVLDEVRRLIRRLDFAGALKAVEPMVREDQKENAVFQLLFVVLIGRGEIVDASKAYQTWFLRVGEEERMQLGVLRACFDRDNDYENWKKPMLDARNADLIAALPRLLLIACDLSEGKYEQARTNLNVALRAEQKNATLIEINRLLMQSKYEFDAEAPKPPLVKDPRVLLGEGEKLFRERQYHQARSKYIAAAEADPTLKDLQLCLLKVNFALGDYERAVAQLELIFTAQAIETAGAEAFSLPIAGAYGDSGEFNKHLAALVEACNLRPLSDKPWELLGAIQYGRRNYADARDALQRYSENNTGTPNAAAMKLLESAKKLAK